ncbi:MAG: nitroreductase family protein [Erysipelotrichaceae bacterium]
MKTIEIRRSVRSFAPTAVEKTKLTAMLQAAMQAPSAGNQQPWEFVVVEDPTILEALSTMSPYATPTKQAPCAIVFLANTDRIRWQEYWQHDLAAAVQNSLLEAVEQGLGTVWMSAAPDTARMTHIQNVLDLPAHLLPFCIVAVGIPTNENANQKVDRFDASRITWR